MGLFTLSNQIFNQGLSVRELCVYAYLCSIHTIEQTLEHQGIVHVKQTTIGENCGISSVQTVKKVIDKLIGKGLVTQLQRSVKHGGYRGTYYYNNTQLERLFVCHISPLSIFEICQKRHATHSVHFTHEKCQYVFFAS